MKKKKNQKKAEIVRKRAILPDIIHLGNYLTNSRFSKKEFKRQCKGKSLTCTNPTPPLEKCKIHTMTEKLLNLKNKFKEVFKESETIPKDWERSKQFQFSNQGYLNRYI